MIWKFVETSSPFEALKLLPGRSGMDILIAGLEKAGADTDAIRAHFGRQ